MSLVCLLGCFLNSFVFITMLTDKYYYSHFTNGEI